ncbi:MAG TPA: lipid II flippase MurJ, partial [Alphaproteobacteria bacterium]|nr:lipid II flippase MurJ [Alphaproteobacteria bacterium]
WRAGIRFRVRWPALPQEARAFFGNFGPAVVGSAGVQLALFADTMLVSFLAAGEPSSLYFADRINQLP